MVELHGSFVNAAVVPDRGGSYRAPANLDDSNSIKLEFGESCDIR